MTISRSKLKCITTVFLVVSTWNTLNLHEGFAQRPLRDINGIVTDQHLVPLKGAVVLVQNEQTGGVVSYITRADGHYSFKRLEGDTDYRIRATAHGHRSKARNLSVFDSNKAKTINLVISFQ